MAKWHGISRRKSTGGRLKHSRGKRRTEISSENQFAYLGEEDQRKNYRKTAGSQTVRLLAVHESMSMTPKKARLSVRPSTPSLRTTPTPTTYDATSSPRAQ